MGRASVSRASKTPTWPQGGVITTATLRDATKWNQLVSRLGYPSLVRHGLRHTALTWMADSGVPLYVLQRVAGHQDPAVTVRYLHPDHDAVRDAGGAFSAWWGLNGDFPRAASLVRGCVRPTKKGPDLREQIEALRSG